MELKTKNLLLKSKSLEELIALENECDDLKTKELYRKIIDRINEFPKHIYFNTIFDCFKNDQKIGFLRFKGVPDKYGVTEVYFEIFSEFQNNGYATEALLGLIEFGFKDPRLHTLVGVVRDSNIQAARVLAKCKFKYKEEGEEGNIFERYK